MPNENTPEYAKALYDHAASVARTQELVYAAQLLEKLASIGDEFYTAFALALLEQSYKRLGRNDLAKKTIERVIRLPKSQQELLNPGWVASCYQRLGDFKSARGILQTLRQITPDDAYSAAALAEMALFERNPAEALALSQALHVRPEAAYQILGRMLSATAFLLKGDSDSAAKEVSWVGEYLKSAGAVPAALWDYSEIQQLVTSIPGKLSGTAILVFQTLSGQVPIASFLEFWNQMAPTPPGPSGPPVALQFNLGKPQPR